MSRAIRQTDPSPTTGGVYPSGWSVHVASQNLSLTLTPEIQNQELVTTQSTGVAYWEGAVRIAGQLSGHGVAGEGYVELTGYADVPATSQTTALP